ncbi:MAG TPA: hypothetical protein VNI61_12820 [Gemmatimonadales bacterium]|nr:hypothetical protein [Gemmatimonadales bacterium]
MRALLVAVALVALPVYVATAQNRGEAAAAVSADGKCATADEHRSETSWDNRGQAAEKIGERRGCSPVPPAPSCGVAAPGGGQSSISGWVELDADNRLPGWCVELTGSASGFAATDGSGAYEFVNVPDGDYLVCLVVPAGWRQTMPRSGPPCPSGYPGRPFRARDGMSSSFMWFRVAPQ